MELRSDLSVEWATWEAMLVHPHVHPPWRESFTRFVNDVGRQPTPYYTFTCIVPRLGYIPYNARWLTALQQRELRVMGNELTLHGETKTLLEWNMFYKDFLWFELDEDTFLERLRG